MTVSGLSLRRRLALALAGLGLTVRYEATKAQPVFGEIVARDGTGSVGEVARLTAATRRRARRSRLAFDALMSSSDAVRGLIEARMQGGLDTVAALGTRAVAA